MSGLITGDFTESDEPFALFQAWLKEAEASEPNDPNAMALATVDETGLPNVRMVLLKGFDENGFVFYTNTESNKGRELLGQRKAAFVIHWKSLRRQVRAEQVQERREREAAEGEPERRRDEAVQRERDRAVPVFGGPIDPPNQSSLCESDAGRRVAARVGNTCEHVV